MELRGYAATKREVEDFDGEPKDRPKGPHVDEYNAVKAKRLELAAEERGW